MIRLFWKGTLATALVCAAMSGEPVSAGPTSSSKKKSTETEAAAKGETIVLQEGGKPDRKCTIISSTPKNDGTIAHQVKALDNGEIMTIIEPIGSGTAMVRPVAKTPTATTEAPKTSKATAVKSETVPSAMNPPKAIDTKVSTKSVPVEKPKGAQLTPLEAPKGVASVSEPAPIPMNQPAMLPVNRVPAPTPAMTSVSMISQTSGQVAQLKEMLKDAVQPSHREIAAEGLCATAQGTSPEVRQLLLTAVKQDPAATVRATCLRCLAKQQMMDEVFQAAMISAQKDQDSRVRSEAKSISMEMTRK